jgi:hypothetical protein
MNTNLGFSSFNFDDCLTKHQHFSEEPDGCLFSSSSIPSPQFTYQSHRPLLSSFGNHDGEIVRGHPEYILSRRPRHFMDLSEAIRHRIYKLVLNLDNPHRVFVNYDREWKRLHLTQGEKIQHSAAITKIELKKPPPIPNRKDKQGNLIPQEVEHGRLSFTLREFSKDETRTMSRALWPSILRVSKEARFVGTKLFYGHATFTAPGDPWTIPEWEARLPIVALQHLSQNRSLTMEHVCCEVQQWRCLRNYLYNPLRQPYTVIDPRRLADLWGPREIDLRRQLPSTPWRFTQLYTLDEEYDYNSLIYPNSKLDLDSALHEVLHSEFLAEVQRISLSRDQDAMEAQLYHLAYGMRTFFEKMVNLEEFEGFVELAGWLETWLHNPLEAIPGPLYERRCPGGLFFGMYLWEKDILDFARDLQRNAKNGGTR